MPLVLEMNNPGRLRWYIYTSSYLKKIQTAICGVDNSGHSVSTGSWPGHRIECSACIVFGMVFGLVNPISQREFCRQLVVSIIKAISDPQSGWRLITRLYSLVLPSP